MADPAKYVCEVDGCGYGSEAVVSWKLGRGIDMPFTGGKVGQRDGKHHQMKLCRRHRIEAIDAHPRPYKAQPTQWGARPDKFGLVISDAGDLLVPGVAVG